MFRVLEKQQHNHGITGTNSVEFKHRKIISYVSLLQNITKSKLFERNDYEVKKNLVDRVPYELVVKRFMNQSDSLLKNKESKLFEGNVFEERKKCGLNICK